MLASKETQLIVLGIICGIAGVLVGVITLWYYIKYIRATKIYLRTRDLEAWSNSIRRIGTRTAVAVFLLTFVATEACIFAFMVEAEPLRTAAMLRNSVISGVVISLLLASFVLVHARWQDIMKILVRLLHGRQSGTEEAESMCDMPDG